MQAPGSPAPRLAQCTSLAVLGGDDELAHAIRGALAARGVALRAAAPDDADLIVCAQALALEDPLEPTFIALTALATRAQKPRMLVAVGAASGAMAGVEGLVKTAALEWEAEALCLAVAPDVAVAEALAAELTQGGGAREVRYADLVRAERVRVVAPLGTARRPIPAGVWVISGGARGVTAACAVELARAGMRQVVLLGRTALVDEPAAALAAADEAQLRQALVRAAAGKPDLPAIATQAREILAQREARATIAALEAAGATVRYAPVDVCDDAAVRALLDDVRAHWGPIRGLVHAAGVLADKALGAKTVEQFRRVVRTKLAGAGALLAATAHDPLEMIAFFSSVAAHSGNVGQSDYAAANAILDRWAEEERDRREGRCTVVSIAWGPWDGGMVTPSLARHFAARGIALIPVAGGARAFVDELTAGQHVNVVVGCGVETATAPRTTVVRFDVAAQPFLRDHTIQGTVVVPMTMALDWLLLAARREFGARAELHELTLLTGVTVPEGSVALTLTTAAADHGALVATLTHPDGRLAYRALLRGGGDAPPAPIPLPPRPAVLPAAATTPYAEALFHGPQFAVIREVLTCDDAGISARIATAGAMGWPAVWQLDPAALDGGLQLLRVWGFAADGVRSLPTSIARVRAFGEWPTDGEVGCQVRARREGALRLRADVTFTDPSSGRVLAALDGVVMHVHG